MVYPAIGTIARELHLSRRTVERGINDLLCAGLLTKEQRWRENEIIVLKFSELSEHVLLLTLSGLEIPPNSV